MSKAASIDPVTGGRHRTTTLWSVQYLRGLAALMIVVGHSQTAVALRSADAAFHRSTLLPWGAGVDLFFVISGFVMVHASTWLFGAADGSRRFLLRRLARIVPLYWLASAAMLLLLGLGSLRGGDPFPGAAAILATFAFVPFPTWGGGLFPVIDLGWTLNYEMFFYLLFAIAVALPRRGAIAFVVVAIVGLSLAGAAVPPGSALWFWSRPIMADFGLGVLVGALVAEGLTLPAWARIGLGIGGACMLVWDPTLLFAGPTGVIVPNEWPRVLWAGLPCAALIAGATLGREPPLPRVLRPLAALGDASYSLYLLHPFSLIVLEKLMQKSAAARHAPGAALAFAAVVLAVAIALVVFRTVERPITAWLTRHLGAAPRTGGSAVLRGRSA